MKRYRSFEEVYPNAMFDVDRAFITFWEGYPTWMDENKGTAAAAFKAGWEAAEKKLMSIEEKQ